MFYVDIDNKKFIPPPVPKHDSGSPQRPPSGCSFPPSCPPPARSWESLCGSCNPYRPPVPPIKKPVLVFTQVTKITLALVHQDGTPVDITDQTFAMAIDNTFQPDDPLIAFSDDFTITDPVNGVVSFNVGCSSVKFEKMLQAHIPPSQVMIEVIRYLPGSSQGVAILQDRGIELKPRLYAWEGIPQPAGPNYYTKAQVDALIKGEIPDDSDSSTGIVIYGEGNPDNNTGNSGDIYINTEDRSIWIKNQTQWVFLGYTTSEPLSLYYEIIED